MQTNHTPHYDASVNTTGCCPRFDPQGWDHQKLHFSDKRFVAADTFSLFHIPINMGKVFGRVHKAIEQAKAAKLENFLVLSEELSPRGLPDQGL